MTSDQFCLKWNNYQANIVVALGNLKLDEDFVDVTLACDGKTIKAHRVVLSACSSYFKHIFKENPSPHPVVILKDVRHVDLESLVKYMYAGQVYIAQDQLGRFLKTAEALQVKGLAENPNISSKPEGAEEEEEEVEEEREGEEELEYSRQFTSHTFPEPNRLLSLPPSFSSPLHLPPFQHHPTPPSPSLSPSSSTSSSLPSPGKAIHSSPIKVPSPPTSTHKTSSFSTLAHYLSGGPQKPPSPSLDSLPSSKRRKTTPKRYNEHSAPNISSTFTYSSSLSASPNSLEGGEEEVEEDKEEVKQVAVMDEDEDSRDELIIAENKPEMVSLEETGVDLSKRKTDSFFQVTTTAQAGNHQHINHHSMLEAQQIEKIQASFPNHEGEGSNSETATTNTSQATHPRNRWRCMQPRVCEYCWKTFSNSFNLKQHIVNVHIQSQGVTCTMCDKVVKNKWYLRKHLVTAHGAPLKRAKGSNGEPKTQETNANGKVQDASKALPKSENIFEFSECQPNGPLGRKPADPHEKHMERQNEEDINEELDVDN